jgi:hypothetical protein
MTFALAQAIEGCMSGDAVQPTANGFGIAQRIAAAIGAEKRFLSQVFGLRGISHDAEEIAIDSIVIFVEEQPSVDGFGCRCHSAI